MGNCDFVDLAAWAKTKSLRLSWVSTNSIVGLTNRSNGLRGSVGSRQVEINGVKTWLRTPSPPNGLLYITTLDMRTLLDPILAPVRNKPGHRVRVIALDPGHGAGTPVSRWAKSRRRFSLSSGPESSRHGSNRPVSEVILTRAKDVYLGLDDRVAAARRPADPLSACTTMQPAREAPRPRALRPTAWTPADAPSTNARPEQHGSTARLPGNTQDTHNILPAYHVHKSMVTRMRIEIAAFAEPGSSCSATPTCRPSLSKAAFSAPPTKPGESPAPPNATSCPRRSQADGVLAYKRLCCR